MITKSTSTKNLFCWIRRCHQLFCRPSNAVQLGQTQSCHKMSKQFRSCWGRDALSRDIISKARKPNVFVILIQPSQTTQCRQTALYRKFLSVVQCTPVFTQMIPRISIFLPEIAIRQSWARWAGTWPEFCKVFYAGSPLWHFKCTKISLTFIFQSWQD